jgi:hypothetical protein
MCSAILPGEVKGKTYKKERGDVLGLDGYMGESIELL